MLSRDAAFEILKAVLDHKQPLDEAFSRRTAALEVRDRAFVRALVALALRRKGEIDAIIDACLDRPLSASATGIRHVLTLGLTQVLFMETAAHAAVATTVDLARTMGFTRQSGLVNAVLRRVLRNPNGFAAARAQPNAPDWLLAAWAADYGAETAAAIAAAHLKEPPLDLSLRAAAEAPSWAERLNAVILPNGSLRCRPSGPVEALPGYAEGVWWVQDAAAALPARLLGDVAGKRVADLCAAPGGKTLQLAAMGALVTAIDRSAPRLRRLRENLERTHLSAETVVADVATWTPEQTFNAVLLDAPCSATGTIRRHPDVAWTKTANDVAALAGAQTAIIADVARLLNPGGVLVYCVCSLQSAEETAAAATPPPGLRPDPIRPDEVGGWGFAVRPDGTLRALPCHLSESGGMDGFYAARFIKPTA